MADLSTLLAALAETVVPDLDDAACAGLAPLHDDDVVGEDEQTRQARHHRAQSVCRACPALIPCRTLQTSLSGDVNGVWAGEVIAGAWRPKRA
jgi:hypothetical protein